MLFTDDFAVASISAGLVPFRAVMLFLFSLLNITPSAFTVPFDLSESRSGLSEELLSFFWDPVEKMSLMRVPGDMPRLSLEGLLLELLSCDSAPRVAA